MPSHFPSGDLVPLKIAMGVILIPLLSAMRERIGNNKHKQLVIFIVEFLLLTLIVAKPNLNLAYLIG